MCFIISQPRPWPLRCERKRMANSPCSPLGIVVQAHDAEHAAGFLRDGDEGHGMGGIVMDELVDQLGLTSRIGAKKRKRRSSRVTSLRKSG